MLTYRMIGRVSAPRAAQRIVEPAVYRWIDSKSYDSNRLGAAWTDLGKGARAARFAVGSRDHNDLRERYVLREDSGYVTTITVDELKTDSCRLWIDVESPATGPAAATPRIVRDIVAQADVFDGVVRLTSEPEIINEESLPTLYEAINDEHRAASVLVAGTPFDFPLERWRDLVGEVTRKTVGLASTFVLTPTATDVFQRQYGHTRMEPRAGAIRTYLAGAYLDDDSDHARHKTLGAERLATDRAAYLARILEHATRDAVLAQALPTDVNRLDRVLVKAQFEDLVGAERSPETQTDAVAPQSGSPSAVAAAETPATQSDAAAEPLVHAAMPGALRGLLESVRRAVERWAQWPPSVDEVEAIVRRLRETPDEVRQRTTQATERLQAVESERDTALESWRSAESQREDLDIELAETLERAQRLEKENLRLRLLAQELGRAEDAWASEEDDNFQPPTDYLEAIDRGQTLPHLRFFLNQDDVVDLQAASSSLSRPPQVLRGLEALSDYARSCNAKTFQGSFREYLLQSPDGCRVVPPKWLASGESKTVRQDRSMAAQRVFAVPSELVASGEVTVMTHLRFGMDTRDPRMYFYDDSANSGEIWVLYLGRHKDVKGTN
jgi:hypothetical protein